MKNVLVPIDGSPAAARALAHALKELHGSDRHVHLLNVQAKPMHPWPGRLVPPDVIESELQEEGARVLAAAQAIVQQAGADCTVHVRIGAAAEEIAACAVKQGCDAIVMGTRGMSAVAGLVLGSVAQRVVHLANLPLTLVK